MEDRMLMEPTLALRLTYASSPARNPATVDAVAEILLRSCFAPLVRVALETRQGRDLHHSKTSADKIRAFFQDPRCDAVVLDSGRHRDLVASAFISTGLVIEADYWDVYPGPLRAEVIVPHEPALIQARLDAFCELAVVLHAIAGCASMEMDFGMAHNLAVAHTPRIERDLKQPGMTIRRLRERDTFDKRTLDREIPSPEWGLFLGKRHLEVISADVLEASGVFHAVRRLGDDLVFVQLTPDPMDALREDYDDMLDPMRKVLAPLLADTSSVTLT